MRRSSLSRKLFAGALGLLLFIAVTALNAQVKTQTTTTRGQAAKVSTIERGEVVYVSGNDLVVRGEDGQIHHFPNIPEDARIDVDGKQLGIHDLRPGMKLQRTITTTTTPKTVTTVQSVTGTVWSVNPPLSVILTLENGTNQSFKIPKDQKFMVDGVERSAFGLKKGMKVTATKIVEEPMTVVEQRRKVTGSMPPPPPAPPADAPILIAEEKAPAPVAAAAAEPEPKKLPKTGSMLPLLGLLGILSSGASFGIRMFRRS